MRERLAKTTLSDGDVLAAWERGTACRPVERTLAILAGAGRDDAADELASRPLGMLDAALLGVHAGTFGEQIDALAACPECGEVVELSLRAGDLHTEQAEPGTEHQFTRDGYRVRFRTATLADLTAAAGRPSISAAESLIVERCVVGAERDGEPVTAAALPDALVDTLSSRMAAIDPQADLRLSLSCPACEHRWWTPLDVTDLVWRELEDRALWLFGEVAVLAAAYGWSEQLILAMSATRRRVYADLVAS
jgi:hypothetical protein